MNSYFMCLFIINALIYLKIYYNDYVKLLHTKIHIILLFYKCL
ncbi:MAG: hypothetical protein Q8830_01195 [Candidatus Phytoplasma australasiaticum]|nr:hypothetical protein [Candidatus Phytoplasma australasiaticum]